MRLPTETLICIKTHQVTDLHFYRKIILEENKKYKICFYAEIAYYIKIDPIWQCIGKQFNREFFISEKELRKQKILKINEMS